MMHKDDLELDGVPDAKLAVAGNVFVKSMHFKKDGQIMRGHKHTYDHITLLAKGSVRATVGEATVEFKAPHLLVTRAGEEHSFVALEDDTILCCIHALRDDDGEVLPEDADIKEAYAKINLLTDD